MNESKISTKLIQEALNFYEKKGYLLQDVPMVVDKEVSDITKPGHVQDLDHNEKVYVGSAEQGFLQMYKDGLLKDFGKYMAITPCFRNEHSLNETHFLMFLKVELMIISDTPKWSLEQILKDANDYFSSYSNQVKRENISNSEIDLMLNDIEIGSYGIRAFNNNEKYVYGTGLAEPRFSYAMKKS